MMGAGWPTKSPDAVVASPQPGTMWTKPLYSCVSATKAIIKSVTFEYNTTRGLQDLKVVQIADKLYDNEEDKPLWAVESVNRNLSQYDPIWGLTDPKYKDHANISTLRKEYLWLPGAFTIETLALTDDDPNLPGVNFHTKALTQVYDTPDGVDYDYSGTYSFGVLQKWANLSRTEDGASQIINLIWTDIVANGIVGTRGWMSHPGAVNLVKRNTGSASDNPLVSVYPNVVKVRFHYVFGIPALVVVIVTIILTFWTVILALRQRIGPAKLRKYIDLTSFGLNTAALLFSHDSSRGSVEGEERVSGHIASRPFVVGGKYPRVPKDGPEVHVQLLEEYPRK